MFNGPCNGLGGNLVKHDPVNRLAGDFFLQGFAEVPGYGFPFAVMVAGQIDGFRAFGSFFQLVDDLAFFGVGYILGLNPLFTSTPSSC
jgi:hypothetical protein